MLKKIIIFIVIIIIALGSGRLGYYLGEDDAKSKLHNYLYDLSAIDQKLTAETANKSFKHDLQPGEYILEIHSPNGVVSDKVTITFTNGSYVFTAANFKPVSPALPAEIVGNTIKWSWDLGYSGSEDYIGYIQEDCLIGTMYGNTFIAKWLIKKKQEDVSR